MAKKSKREQQLERALKDLINLYVKNQGSETEFITCITPKNASSMTFRERRENKTWRTFDDAMDLLQEG